MVTLKEMQEKDNDIFQLSKSVLWYTDLIERAKYIDTDYEYDEPRHEYVKASEEWIKDQQEYTNNYINKLKEELETVKTKLEGSLLLYNLKYVLENGNIYFEKLYN